MDENKIVIYQTEDGQTQIDVRLENETVWLTQAQMAELFERTPQNITMHIRNAYNEGELEKESTCKEYLQVQTEGKSCLSHLGATDNQGIPCERLFSILFSPLIK